MAVYFDASNGDIHPPNKRVIGERLALAARRIAFGEQDAPLSPVFEKAEKKGNKLEVSFSEVSRDGLIGQRQSWWAS